MEKEDIIYVVGHKNPDTDSVCSAILLAKFFNKASLEEVYVPAILGKPNRETLWVLKKWGVEVPQDITNEEIKKVFLVDHNERNQGVGDRGEIVGIYDHHNLNCSYDRVIPVTISPRGSTASLIMRSMESLRYEMTDSERGLMLSAILSDTLGLTSSTTTLSDRILANSLSKALNIKIEDYTIEMFQHTGISDLSGKEIFNYDLKSYSEAGNQFTIGQAFAFSETEVEDIQRKIKKHVSNNKIQNNFFMITNVFLKSTTLLTTINNEKIIEKQYGFNIKKNKKFCSVVLYNSVSRKKDVLPKIRQYFIKNQK